MKPIYLDHAAAAPVSAGVRRAISAALTVVGNPSSYNDSGREAADLLSRARTTVARFLGARPQEIIFTASGSEANALAIHGITKLHNNCTILTTPIEHLSVLENARASKCKVVLCKVNKEGVVDLVDLRRKLRATPMLVSVMYANNEIGTVEPIIEIGKLIRSFRKEKGSSFPLFHVDACQAAGYLPMRVDQLGVDLMTLNGSKIYGPRGIGVLYVRRGITISPLIAGGGQEHGLRAGTENIPAIVGMAQAVSEIDATEGLRVASLRDYFFDRIVKTIPDVRINGPMKSQRLANNIHISIPGLDSENLLLELDTYGIQAGSGSACTARSVEPSHVLKSIGVKRPYLDGALRFSMGRSTTKKDIDTLLSMLREVVKNLRKRYRMVRR